ncbi:hypothetical protein CDL12_24303 [Handroanthus impetiginosus]|uniref:Uncharacterized protein n=1 Tax=Handroanthus impetiginosus TaxID=429701 RepID=A0A2G9GD19_9LAMI|nr:hypothetical protein CDL12_24303 [Handroanthus impetiginosus]
MNLVWHGRVLPHRTSCFCFTFNEGYSIVTDPLSDSLHGLCITACHFENLCPSLLSLANHRDQLPLHELMPPKTNPERAPIFITMSLTDMFLLLYSHTYIHMYILNRKRKGERGGLA